MKNVGVPETPLASALATSSRDARGVLVSAHLAPEALDVEPELARDAVDVTAARARPGGPRNASYISQKCSLRGGRLDRLGGELRAAVDVVQRQVAPDVANVVVGGGEQLADDRLGLAAVRALEVAVLDERDRRVFGAADVVALGVDVLGEVDEVLRGAADLARANGARQAFDER